MTGLIVDLFAGGGGASIGIRQALGREPDVAVNHDAVAIAMHRENHPGCMRQLTTSIPRSHWMRIHDGDLRAKAIFHRHYSRRRYRDGRDPVKIIGPGQYLMLMTHDEDALFAWRKFISMDRQVGLCCAIFRNEGPILSSELILDAEGWAAWKWPMESRYYTYVNPRRVRSSNPGYCFLMAGWNRCGVTKSGLTILDKLKG